MKMTMMKAKMEADRSCFFFTIKWPDIWELFLLDKLFLKLPPVANFEIGSILCNSISWSIGSLTSFEEDLNET